MSTDIVVAMVHVIIGTIILFLYLQSLRETTGIRRDANCISEWNSSFSKQPVL